MALIYDQRILDLGEHGLLILTLDSSSGSPPLPAHKFGYARWVDVGGSEADRLALCTRRVTRAKLMDQVDEKRKQYSGAVAAVRGRLEWVAGQAGDDYLEAPTGAFALEGGHVLLAFCASRPAAFRLVNVVAAQMLWEESVDDLRRRLGITVPSYLPSLMADAPVVYATGARHICVYLGQKIDAMCVGDTALQSCTITVPKDWFSWDYCFALDSLLMYSRDTGDLRIAPLDGQGGIVDYASPLRKKAMSGIASSPYAGRFALSHPGGAIEIVGCGGRQEAVLRPIARTGSKDPLGVDLSLNGRFLVASEWNQARLVDIDERRLADILLPDANATFDHNSFSSEIIYRTTWANTDRGGFVLEDKVLRHTPLEALAWQALPHAGGRRKAPGHAPKSTLKRVLDQWRNPALALTPAKQAACVSRLCGVPYVGVDFRWPEHEGRPMLFLCQIDLVEAATRIPASPLPKQGGLLFFVASDDEGEPLLNDDFNPAAACVLWLPVLAPSPLPGVDGSGIPAQPIEFAASTSDLPQPDAAIVRAAGLTDDDYESYRALIEERLPDGAAKGHRLGGYPHLLQSNTLEADAHYLTVGASPTDEAQAAKWRLLLQLDSDDVFMWGTDSGLLYFMIHDDDLRVADFSRVVVLSAGC